AYMAATMIGAIAVTMNSWWQSNELVFGLKDSGTRVLFADQERINAVKPVLGQVDVKVIAIKHDAGCNDFPECHTLVEEGRSGPQADLDALDIQQIGRASGRERG